jgi:hypothetical protein
MTFFKCSIPSLTVNIYANSKEEALSELDKRIERAAPILSDPSFDRNHPGTGFVYVGYDSTAITVGEEIRAKLYVAAKVNGETLPPFFVRHDPLTGDPVGENDQS